MLEQPTTGLRQLGFSSLVVMEALALVALAAAVRWLTMPQEPVNDELFHVLAARQYLVDGTLSINGGVPYARAQLFTLIVAAFYSVFGDSLIIARLPAMIAGSLVVAVTFLWLRLLDQRWAGWIAGILLSFDPVGIALAQMSRFYTFQQLMFLLGVIAVYFLVARKQSRPMSILLAVTSIIFLALALHFQRLSIIGIGGLLLFVVAARGPELARRLRSSQRRWWLISALTAAVVSIVGYLVVSGELSTYIYFAQFEPFAGARDAGDIVYYHTILLDHHSAIWPLFPLFLLLAITRQARLSLFCTCIFAVTLVTESIVPWKGARFLTFVMPMFMVVTALGVVEICSIMVQRVNALLRNSSWLVRHQTLIKPVLVASVLAVLMFAAGSNRSFYLAGIALTKTDLSSSFPMIYPQNASVSWKRASSVLKPVADSVSAVVSSSPVKTFYFLDRLDYVLNLAILMGSENEEGREFGIDRRFARPVISTPESIEAIMACHKTGLLIIEHFTPERAVWTTSVRIPQQTAEFIVANTETIALPEKWGLLAFRWTKEPWPGGSSCVLEQPSGG